VTTDAATLRDTLRRRGDTREEQVCQQRARAMIQLLDEVEAAGQRSSSGSSAWLR
jgi:hypothetical protein